MFDFQRINLIIWLWLDQKSLENENWIKVGINPKKWWLIWSTVMRCWKIPIFWAKNRQFPGPSKMSTCSNMFLQDSCRSHISPVLLLFEPLWHLLLTPGDSKTRKPLWPSMIFCWSLPFFPACSRMAAVISRTPCSLPWRNHRKSMKITALQLIHYPYVSITTQTLKLSVLLVHQTPSIRIYHSFSICLHLVIST